MTTRGFEDFRHLDAVLALIGGEAANVDRLLQSFDADPFCRWCLRQQVGGLAYLLLEDASLRVGPAKALLAGLRAAYLDQWARSERLRLHLATLDRLLRRVGADYLVLKGLPFALRYYGAYDRRSTGDIDIWVRRGDAHRVATALEGEGLVRRSPRYSDQSSAFEHLHHVELTLDGIGVADTTAVGGQTLSGTRAVYWVLDVRRGHIASVRIVPTDVAFDGNAVAAFSGGQLVGIR